MSASTTSVLHHTFTVERTYAAAPARVFRAFEDPRIKRQWFIEGEGWEVEEYTFDFRVGGREFSRFRFRGGDEITNDTTFFDIVPDQRIVIAYWMTMGDRRITTSLATIEFKPTGTGTKLVFTEQIVFLDGSDHPAQREEGTRELLEKLGDVLDRTA
jgi:uncharacterized protein YndB with AHSA1/START domain